MDVHDESETTESFCEEEAPDEIPQSLLIYFETSRSRAVICERLILEDNNDCEEPYSVMNFSSDNDLDSLDQPQINSVRISGSNDANPLLCHSPCTEVSTPVPEIEIEKNLEEDLTEESLSQSEKLWTERERRVCDAQKMEEQRRRRRESEFELELRRLEEAERMQQTELELMAKRAQAKLEQEMLLQQEMMKDLKKRVAEESRRRREEQAEFKREQETRREEERRKTETLRQRRRDTATQIQAEEMNAPPDLIRVDKVIMDGLGEHSQEMEREKAAVSHANNTHHDKALMTKEEVTSKTCILESTYDDETRSTRETMWAKVRNVQEEVMSKNTQRLKVKVKEKDERLEKEGLQKIQSKVGEARDGDAGIQSEMQEKGNIPGKEEEEEGANCDEDNNLHKEDGMETHKQGAECKAAEKESLVVQHNEKAMIESKDTPKEIVKKKILISCNFLRNSLKFRQKAASNSLRDVETGEKGCKDNGSNGSKISQEKGPNSSADITNNSSGNREDHLLNEIEIREDGDQAAILETGNEGEAGLKHNTFDTFKNDQGNSRRKCTDNDKCTEVGDKTGDTVQEDKLPVKKDKLRVSNIEDKRGNADSTCGQSLSKGRREPNRNYTGKNANLETVKKEECSVSVSQDGTIPDMDNVEQEETKNEVAPNVSKISQEKGPNTSADITNNSSSGNRGSREDNLFREDHNEAAILETGNEGETGLKHKKFDTVKNDQGNSRGKCTDDNNDKCREVCTSKQSKSNKIGDTVQGDKLKEGKIRESNMEDKRGNADSTCGRSWSKERQGTSQTDRSTSPNRELKSNHLNEKDNIKETSSNRKTNSTQKCGSNEKAAMCFNPNDLQTGNCEAFLNLYASCDMGRRERNRSYTGKNAILETVNKVDCSVSIAQDGDKPDTDNVEQEETKNVAKISSKFQSKTVMLKPGDGGTEKLSLEKPSMKSEEIVAKVKVSRNLHEHEIFLKTFTVSPVSRDFEDVSEENCSEGLKEVGLLNESPRFMNAHEMFSKDIMTLTSTESTSQVDEDSENSNTAEVLWTVREDGKGTSEIDKERRTEAATSRAWREEEAPNARAMTGEMNQERDDMGLEGGSCWSGLCLPEQTEQKRLRWMRECESWSKLCVQRNLRKEQGAVLRRRGPKRAAAAGGDDLPPLASRTLLHNTGMTALAQLTTVILQDLSGCSLSTLSQCLCLQSLSLRRCGLRALKHVNKLHQLCSIDAEENEITFVDCENMSRLKVLRLGHNRLSSIHGLDGAENLTELDLSHNLITRIAGVESLRRLQSLSLSHNQLISSRGVSSLSSLLHLDLSQNQLDSVQGLDHCALLCTLCLSGNGLTQPPDLKNHVLLRELHLDDNSISSLHSLTQYWLPMMQHLTVAQNSLTELPSLCDFVSLENLDLRLNCLSELNGVCESLRKCLFIRDICLEGNPLEQEPGWRSILRTAAPGLGRIDGQLTDSPSAGPRFSPAAGSFLSLCRNQIQQTAELRQRHSSQISAASSPLDVLKISCRRLEEVFRLAEEHRFQHELGDTFTTSESERETSALEESNSDTQKTDEEAALIQQTSGPSTGTEERGESQRAATVIQACWRGVSLRRRLRDALARAHRPDPGWDEGLEEPDVDGFVLDGALLDGDWSLPDDFTETHFPVLERPPSPKPSEFFTGESLTVLPPVTDFRPKQAWTSDEQNINTTEEASPSDFVGFCSWTPYNVGDQSLSCQRIVSPPSSAEVSGLSEGTEKIMEEWGFKDANTALLMLKRARKMKSKRELQQKLKDPSVRLALFKRSASQMRPTEPRQPRAVVPGGETGETATGHRDETHLSSESFLPRMSRAILDGGRVQLVTDPGRVCVASQSGPAVSSAPRNSSGRRYETELPCPKRGASTPLTKERISFRDNKLQLSGGWGSGKKRSKVCK